MVRDHPVRHGVVSVRGPSARLGRRLDEVAEQIDTVDVVPALEHGRDPLQPHARIDRGPGQVDSLVPGNLLELHEDEVPDFDEPVAVLAGAARRAAGNVVAVIVEDLGTRPAGARGPHRPEIVGGRDADDPAFRQPGDLLPQIEGLVVLGVYRGQQPVRRQPEFPGHQFPRELDRQFLEVVPEGEIAQHLEKRGVPRGVAHVVEIVVLAAGAHAFLRRHGAVVIARLGAGEHVLELHHAGVGEHERRVVARHQRARRDGLVAMRHEIVDERLSDVVRRCHPSRLSRCPVGAMSPLRGPDTDVARNTSGNVSIGSMSASLFVTLQVTA